MNTNNNKLFLLLGLLAMTACSSDDAALDLQQPAEPGDYITLDVTAADDATRGAVITSSTIADLRLTGMKYLNTSNIDATSPADFFYNQEVTKASGWKTAFCWPGNKEKVQLFAFAPSAALAATDGGEGVTWSAEDRSGVPTLSYKLPATATNQQDLLVANTAVLDGNTKTGAALSFSHALAKVIVKLGAASLPDGNITKVTIKNVNGTGVYDFKEGKWTSTSTPGTYTQTVTVACTGGANKEIATFFMLPHTLSGASIELTHSNGQTYSKAITGTWEEGKSYTYAFSKTSAYTHSFVGYTQYFKVPATGTYKLEAWGANNGSTNGSYAAGNYKLTAGDVLYIRVGGKMSDNSYFNGAATDIVLNYGVVKGLNGRWGYHDGGDGQYSFFGPYWSVNSGVIEFDYVGPGIYNFSYTDTYDTGIERGTSFHTTTFTNKTSAYVRGYITLKKDANRGGLELYLVYNSTTWASINLNKTYQSMVRQDSKIIIGGGGGTANNVSKLISGTTSTSNNTRSGNGAVNITFVSAN